MKPQQLILLSVLFVVLAAAVLVQKMQTPQNLGFEITRSLDLSFDKEKVQELILKLRDETYELQKKDQSWHVATEWNTRAGEDRVDSFLTQLTNLRGELRSSDPALLGDYGLQDDKALRVELYSSGKQNNLLTLLVGTAAAQPDVTFVRKPGSAEVFAVNRPLLGAAGFQSAQGTGAVREKEFWNDLRLLREDTAEIQEVSFHRGAAKRGGSFTLRKKETGEGEAASWFFPENQEAAFGVDSVKVDDLLQLLSGARALKALDPSGNYGLEQPLLELDLTVKAGKKIHYRISSSGKETKSYFVQSSEDPAVFEIALYHVKRLDLDQRHFFLEDPFLIEGSEVQEVLLKRGAQERFVGHTEDKKNQLEQLALVLEGLDYEVQRLKEIPAWTESSAQLEVHAKENKRWIFDFGPKSKTSGLVPVRAGDDKRIFGVPEKTFQGLFSNLNEVQPEAPAQETAAEVPDSQAPAA